MNMLQRGQVYSRYTKTFGIDCNLGLTLTLLHIVFNMLKKEIMMAKAILFGIVRKTHCPLYCQASLKILKVLKSW